MTITLEIGGATSLDRVTTESRMAAVLELTRRAALGRVSASAHLSWADNMGHHREATVAGDAESVAQLIANLKLD